MSGTGHADQVQHIFCEALLQHFIHFVQDQIFDAAQIRVTFTDMVQQPARGAD